MPDLKTIVEATSKKIVDMAQAVLERTIAEKGACVSLGFEGTAFYLPLNFALTGLEVKTTGDAEKIIVHCHRLLENKPLDNGLLVSHLDGLLDQGLAALLAEELLCALTYKPQDGYLGFVPDTVLRSLGVQLVDGRIAGIAVVIGKARDDASAVKIIRGLQEKNIVSLLVGNSGSRNIRDQLADAGVEMGLDNYIVPLGKEELSSAFAVNFAVRAALTFGGFKGGQWNDVLEYARNRVPAFVVVLGKLDDVIATTGVGVLNLGFPIVTDMDAPQVGKIPTTKYEALVTEKDDGKIVSRCVETRGIKIKVVHVPIPVLYSPAFEGERVRKENLRVEFGSKYSSAFEYLTYKPMDQVHDGRIEVVGEDVDRAGKAMPLGIWVEVAAREPNKDFEPILERQIHRYLNEAQGVMHMGQRDMIWVRIANEAFEKGLRLKHFGTIIHAMLHKEFGAIVDKVQVRILTREADVKQALDTARLVYDARDERLRGMTDERVDTFYSCALCQSFAPNHLCIITPERLGLCGAYSWLDAKAAFEIQPTGGNQPVVKGVCLDANLGQWQNINTFIYDKSNKTIPEVSMYSLLVSPQSSCGCFECIVALVPEANGVMVVNRDYAGPTPLGMTFTQMAGSVGGGVQTPGFIGVGKLYIASKKFISAEGGLPRLVWMPKDLKEALKGRLIERGRDLDLPDFFDKIADETDARTIDELLAFLKAKAHPALEMPPLL
ncbi:MAG: acetyl-CoA decarbonylase/synthase complex subunit alpha/beta [Candidatus Omnitrophica bacterium]|nr:acetyl-CoA decarbonylase/synthase complex subunit alpha/beta [Candidatus Omnitrophota bacterium]MDD5574528.1 acetyl-CoA decarbonylase/synthase complex subunit alpha/beta [Candidatus Omnitrophota bacterium]